MESVLRGIPGTIMYIDDILITAPTGKEHIISRVAQVLGRLQEAGLRLKRGKCAFMAPSVVYIIDAQGLHLIQENVEAIQQAPRPTNVAELKSYLGLLTYYAKFLHDMSTTLTPRYRSF